MNNKYIALGHQSRVGKDTFVNYTIAWCARRGIECHIIRIADKLYKITSHIQETLGMQVQKDPALLQLIGTDLRNHYGESVWINESVRKINDVIHINPNAVIIVVDMRLRNEMELLRAIGFTTVKILRPEREVDRDPNHASETELANVPFDYVINNSNTLENYLGAIDALLDKLIQL